MDTHTIDRDLAAAVTLRNNARDQITQHIDTITKLEAAIHHQTNRIECLLARRCAHRPTPSHL